MSVFQSPNFLRNVMLADAASCLACGALQVAAPQALSQWMHLPSALLAGTGAFLLLYAAVAVFVGTRRPVPRALVGVFAAGNFGWAIACVALLAAGGLAPGALGIAYVLVQAATVVVLAELQWMGIKRAPQPGRA